VTTFKNVRIKNRKEGEVVPNGVSKTVGSESTYIQIRKKGKRQMMVIRLVGKITKISCQIITEKK